jgi:hypothetical protein
MPSSKATRSPDGIAADRSGQSHWSNQPGMADLASKCGPAERAKRSENRERYLISACSPELSSKIRAGRSQSHGSTSRNRRSRSDADLGRAVLPEVVENLISARTDLRSRYLPAHDSPGEHHDDQRDVSRGRALEVAGLEGHSTDDPHEGAVGAREIFEEELISDFALIAWSHVPAGGGSTAATGMTASDRPSAAYRGAVVASRPGP